MLNAKDITGFDLFTGLDELELGKIAKLCTRRMYESNTVIYNPKSATTDVYLLEGGNESIQIEVPVNEGNSKIVIHTLNKGETFGWASLCPIHVRTATARVIERASVIQINGTKLIHLCDENSHMGYVVMRNLSGIINTRLEYTTLVIRHRLQKLDKIS